MALSGPRQPAGADRGALHLRTHPGARLAWGGAGSGRRRPGRLRAVQRVVGWAGMCVGTVRQATCAWEFGGHHLWGPFEGPRLGKRARRGFFLIGSHRRQEGGEGRGDPKTGLPRPPPLVPTRSGPAGCPRARRASVLHRTVGGLGVFLGGSGKRRGRPRQLQFLLPARVSAAGQEERPHALRRGRVGSTERAPELTLWDIC